MDLSSTSRSKIPKTLVNYSTPYILNGEFFEIISQDGENVTVRCCACKTRNIYKGSVKSTGNFHMHIKRKHPDLLPRVHALKLSSFFNRKMIPRKRTELKARREFDFASAYRQAFGQEKFPSLTILPETIDLTMKHIPKFGKNDSAKKRDTVTSSMDTDEVKIKHESNFSVEQDQDETLSSRSSFNIEIPMDQFIDEHQDDESGEEKDISQVDEEALAKQLNEIAGKQNYMRYMTNDGTKTHNSPDNSDEEMNKTRNKEALPSPGKRANRILGHLLKGIEQQLEIRNYIEGKKLSFKINKFKFLNPAFSSDNDDANSFFGSKR